MSERYPGEREIEQLYSQADNVPESGTGTITIRDVQEVMAGANDQVLIDRLELVDLRQQLDDACQARKDIEDSQQAIVILWREQQTRAERAERERDEAQAQAADLEQQCQRYMEITLRTYKRAERAENALEKMQALLLQTHSKFSWLYDRLKMLEMCYSKDDRAVFEGFRDISGHLATYLKEYQYGSTASSQERKE